MRKLNLLNKQFGYLTVEKETVNNGKYRQYICKCRCGAVRPFKVSSLTSGNTRSCGCLHKEGLIKRNTKHNGCQRKGKEKLYDIWAAMIQRCCNPRNKRYPDYGGRGIKVCKRWQHNYKFFRSDIIKLLGQQPTPKHSLDRKDNNKGYYISNMRWATPLEQSRNKRNTVFVEFENHQIPLAELTSLYNQSYYKVHCRIFKLNWPIERALEAK